MEITSLFKEPSMGKIQIVGVLLFLNFPGRNVHALRFGARNGMGHGHVDLDRVGHDSKNQSQRR